MQSATSANVRRKPKTLGSVRALVGLALAVAIFEAGRWIGSDSVQPSTAKTSTPVVRAQHRDAELSQAARASVDAPAADPVTSDAGDPAGKDEPTVLRSEPQDRAAAVMGKLLSMMRPLERKGGFDDPERRASAVRQYALGVADGLRASKPQTLDAIAGEVTNRLCTQPVLAAIIIRYSSHPSVVRMKPTQYRKCDDLSSTAGAAGVST